MYVIKKKTLLIILLVTVLSLLVILPVCLIKPHKNASSAFTVVIDAGHGGVDAGAVGVLGSHESDINLSVAMKLESKLSSRGINVVMTRSTSDGLYDTPTNGFKSRDMRKRKEIIEGANPNIVISVHMNISSVPSVRGAQVFYKKASAEGENFAKQLQEVLNASMEGSKPRLAMSGDYYMLNCTNYTSVIVECGFLSNRDEEKLLTNGEYQDKIAAAIEKATMNYLIG